MTAPSVGVLGLGAMGGAVAQRLAVVGFPTCGWDVAPVARQKILEAGIPCDNIARLRDCDVLLTSLPDDAALLSALLASDREQGILTLLRSGTALIELSTVLPATVHRIADAAHAVGIRVLDCPVSGGPTDALVGNLSLFLGYDGPLEHELPVLEALGRLHRVGTVGAAKTVKIVNNLMSVGNLMLVAEGLRLAQSQGIDLSTAVDVIGASNGASRQLQLRAPRMLDGDFTPGFALRLAAKDLHLAESLAQAAGLCLPVTMTVHDLLESSAVGEFGGKDVSAVFAKYGGSFRASSQPDTPAVT